LEHPPAVGQILNALVCLPIHLAIFYAPIGVRLSDADVAALREGLAALGHQFASIPDSYMDFGAGQFIVRSADGYVAGSDPRRDGQAAGF
jgi:gamma-glutamyltranspeptidase